MPVKVRKVSKGKYRVSHNRKVSAKRTTKSKAEAQRRLLEGVRRGWKPTGKKRKKTKKENNMPRGKPRTTAQRRTRHKKKYGTSKLPKRKHKNWK